MIPTATPESDGTLEWDSTTLVLVELEGGGKNALGYTYADVATARLIADAVRSCANGAYDRKFALEQAEAFAAFGVTWFEEPVSSDDLEGLRLLRDRAPAGMDITAGEYGYDLFYFRRMIEAGAVDVVQPDATRCAGFSEFLRISALCEANNIHLSSHTGFRARVDGLMRPDLSRPGLGVEFKRADAQRFAVE